MNVTDLLPAALPDWCGTETEPANWIEISTACTLFRNLPDLPFPPAARQEERLEVTRRVEDAVQLLAPLGDTLGFTEKELESPVGALLAERHLAARVDADRAAACVADKRRSISRGRVGFGRQQHVAAGFDRH